MNPLTTVREWTKEEILEAITSEVWDHSDPDYPAKDTVLSPEKLAQFLADLLTKKDV